MDTKSDAQANQIC